MRPAPRVRRAVSVGLFAAAVLSGSARAAAAQNPCPATPTESAVRNAIAPAELLLDGLGRQPDLAPHDPAACPDPVIGVGLLHAVGGIDVALGQRLADRLDRLAVLPGLADVGRRLRDRVFVHPVFPTA